MPTSHPTIGLALELADLLRPSWAEFDTGTLVCEDPPADPPAPPADPPAPTPPADPPKPPEDDFDKERAMATIAAQRASEDKLKAELKDAKDKAAKWEAHERDQESEQETLQRERDEAKATAQKATEKARRANLLAELAKPEHGIVDAKAAVTLLLAQGGVEFDDQDEPKNLTAKGSDDKSLLGKFIDSHQFLKGQPSQDPPPDFGGGARGGGQGAAKLTDDELAMAKSSGMTPQEYALWRDDPQAAAAAEEKAKAAAAAGS